jgi:hypothetical protein
VRSQILTGNRYGYARGPLLSWTAIAASRFLRRWPESHDIDFLAAPVSRSPHMRPQGAETIRLGSIAARSAGDIGVFIH